MWGSILESVSTMQASGPRNSGDSGCVQWLSLGLGTEKNREGPDKSDFSLLRPVDGSTIRFSDRRRSLWPRLPEEQSGPVAPARSGADWLPGLW